ncbi:hypothetical protein CC86DRAFT_435377 [Ophiobolus disseminans]|uniref:Nephrocystin 3-like N-terminal domain-containing protein n=1 Tax=Ophiobolus disseminans TaxID=1469910 RepID=A0A6A6ZAK8_9PLEO|nr:hypothetical protein CC86DRAFT_435377 [Ophiobolus disseminans]
MPHRSICRYHTCCINKSNNAELSEAIISMFCWYKNAERCYVYLSDVSSRPSGEDSDAHRKRKPVIRKSRWFTRGWTLQELIALAFVAFFSKEGEQLSDKKSLIETLHEITGIAVQALRGSLMTCFTVDERMRWTQGRTTKREEDSAYSLLGIFDVQMPLLYGEGQEKAWHQLRREIREHHSIDLPVATGASFDSHSEEHNARCLPNTRTELLDAITTWANNKGSKPIFWLSRMAGTGKSTIARTVAKLFASRDQLGASFFFKKVLQPLLGIQQAYLLGLARVIMIDALDECEREEDIRAILQLLAQTKDVCPVPLRIVVTSRLELHIRLGFREMPNGTYQDLVLHEVPKSTIEHDIRLFLEHELGAIRKERKLALDWPSSHQIMALVELAVPLFIYAATVCRFVSTKGRNPIKYLDKVLEYKKKQLLDEQKDDKEEWLIEFREVVGNAFSNSLKRIVPDSKDIPVRLLHLSFREFLINPQKQGRSLFWVNEKSTHNKLASCCLELMSGLSGLRQDMCGLLGPGVLRSEIDNRTVVSSLLPELQYACRYWTSHIIQSQQEMLDREATHLFLQKHLLYWLKAMSLMRESSWCFHLLDSLQALAGPAASSVSAFLHDAKRFILRF